MDSLEMTHKLSVLEEVFITFTTPVGLLKIMNERQVLEQRSPLGKAKKANLTLIREVIRMESLKMSLKMMFAGELHGTSLAFKRLRRCRMRDHMAL